MGLKESFSGRLGDKRPCMSVSLIKAHSEGNSWIYADYDIVDLVRCSICCLRSCITCSIKVFSEPTLKCSSPTTTRISPVFWTACGSSWLLIETYHSTILENFVGASHCLIMILLILLVRRSGEDTLRWPLGTIRHLVRVCYHWAFQRTEARYHKGNRSTLEIPTSSLCLGPEYSIYITEIPA